MSRFESYEQEQERKKQEQANNWRLNTSTHIGVPGIGPVELREASLPSKHTRTRSGKVHSASMPKDWLPGYCVAWSDDCDTRSIIEYNRRLVAAHYQHKRGDRQ